MASTVRVSRGSMIPSSQSRPVAYCAVDSSSIWLSVAWRSSSSAASSKGRPAASAALRRTMERTPASCLGPMTAMRWLGQVKTKRGS